MQQDVDARAAVVDGVGIMRLGRARGKTAHSLGRQHGGAQHADQSRIAHAFHLLVIIGRQRERRDVFRIHARTIHGRQVFVKRAQGVAQADMPLSPMSYTENGGTFILKTVKGAFGSPLVYPTGVARRRKISFVCPLTAIADRRRRAPW